MPNTFFGLTISGSGLNAANIAVNTTAHNISNVNTDGYSRQQTVQKASSSIRVYNTFGTAGTGVAVDDIEQLRSEYYDTKYRDNNATSEYYSTLESYSLLMEDYLDEFNLKGFTTEYQNLFEAVNDLRNDPTSNTARTLFVNYSQSISDYFNTLSTNLSNVQSSANDEVKTTVNQINAIAEQVASLNKQINTIEINGGEANDLRDARALLVDELSGYVNTTTREDDIGNNMTEFYIYIDGQELVDGYDYNSLVLTARETDEKRNASDVDGLYDISWNTGMDFNEYSSTFSGSLKAAIDIRDGCEDNYEVLTLVDGDGNVLKDSDGNPINCQDLDDAEYDNYINDGYHRELVTYSSPVNNPDYKGIPYYQAQINEFAKTMADAFNSIIAKGDWEGKDEVSLFVSQFGDDYISAKNISTDAEVRDDASLLPYSFDSTKGEANTDMADALYALKDKDTIKNGTFLEYLQSMVSVVAIDTSRARSFSSNYSNIKDTIDNQRLSVMGVDEDEEAVDLVKYQNAYNLASKVISVMQEIYDKLIEQTGV